MPVTEAHPSAEELAAFTLGTLDDETQAPIEAHVATCMSCQERAAGTSGDTLVELLRRAQARPAVPADTVTEAPQAHTPPPQLSEAVAVAPSLAAPVGSEPASDLDAIPPELARHERYRVVRLLGEGGMGSVFEAEQIVMQRRVALKVIRRADIASPAALERFRREVRAAARLSHPNIVTAYDAETAGGLHFLVMEYVEGITLAWLVKERGPLPIDEACEYIRQAALGLQHAHERGLVHRDVKPANLIRCSDGTVKILDFGLASLTAENGGGVTEANVVMGTPNFMAPEQAENSHSADIRADLYSLGCTLYFLLTGTPPYPAPTPLLNIFAHRDKPVPSLRGARPDVPQELAAVVERLLAKKPEDRYQTPDELAAALAPFAQPAPLPPKKRHRRLVAALAALLLVGVTIAGGAVYYIQTDKGELVIETDDNDLKVVVSKGGKVVTIIDPKSGKHVTLTSGEYELALKDGQDGLKLSTDKITLKRGEKVLATVTRRARAPGAVAELPPAKKPLDGVVAWWRADGDPKDSVGGHDGTLKGDVTFAPGVAGQAFRLDGGTRSVVVPRSDLWGFGRRDFSIELWVQFRALTPSHDIGKPSAIFIGCDEGGGDQHKWFFGYGDGFLNFCIGNAGKGNGGFYAKADFSPDLDRWYHLAVTRGQDTFTIYVNGMPLASEKDDIIIPNPDAPLTIGQAENLGFFSGLVDEIAIYDRALSPDEVKTRWSALAPDTKPVAGKVGEVVRRFPLHQGGVASVAISPDGRLAATGDRPGTVPAWSVRLWDLASGHEIRRFAGHEADVQCVAFSPDGSLLASAGSSDQTVRIWKVATGKELLCLRHNAPVHHVAFLPDGRHVVAGVYDGSLRMWDVKTGKQVRTFEGHKGPVDGVAVSPDGRCIASASQDRTARLWDTESGKELRQFAGPTHTAYRVAFSPDGRRLLSTDPEAKTVRFWDVESGKEIRQFVGHTGPVWFAVFATDGRRALSSGDGTLRQWDVETGKELHCFPKPAGYLAVSPDGRYVLYGGSDGAALLRLLPEPAPAKEKP